MGCFDTELKTLLGGWRYLKDGKSHVEAVLVGTAQRQTRHIIFSPSRKTSTGCRSYA